MKLVFTQDELQTILRDHIKQHVKLVSDSDYEFTFKVDEDETISVNIEVPYMGVSSIAALITQPGTHPVQPPPVRVGLVLTPTGRIKKNQPTPELQKLAEEALSAKEVEPVEETAPAPVLTPTEEEVAAVEEPAPVVEEVPPPAVTRGPSLFSN